MKSKAGKGSFMKVSDVLKYFEDNQFEIFDYEDRIIIIEGTDYLPTQMFRNGMPSEELKKMECKVTTAIFGLGKSLWEDETINSLEDYRQVEKDRIINTPWER